jgi:NADH-quinone oxidoreductase subunit F
MSKLIKLLTEGADSANPLSVDEYVKKGGFTALKKAAGMSGADIIGEVLKANLLGRGGAA